jgi:hypothetical protein
MHVLQWLKPGFWGIVVGSVAKNQKRCFCVR